MHERMLAAQAKTDFNAAFQAVQDRVDPVPRRGRIDRRDGTPPTPYQLVTMSWTCFRPLLKENQLTYSVSNTESPVAGEVDVRISKNVYKKMPMVRFTLRLRHIAGHEEFHHLDVPAGSGTGGSMNTMQAMASTASYCERHLLCKAFGVITGPDNDGQDVKGQEPITAEQVANIEDLSADVGVGPAFAEFLRACSGWSASTRLRAPTISRSSARSKPGGSSGSAPRGRSHEHAGTPRTWGIGVRPPANRSRTGSMVRRRSRA